MSKLDRSVFDLNRLLDAMLNTYHGNVNKWWDVCEVLPVSGLRHANGNPILYKRQSSWCVRCGQSFLRRTGADTIWDIFYGADSEWYSAEYALLALTRAPVPPWLLSRECWGEQPK